MIKTGPYTFQNFSRTVTADPHHRHTVTGLEDLATQLARAQHQGSTVRVVGAGHSFTALVATSDVLLDLDEFQGIEQVDALSHEVTFRAGTRLWQVPKLLKPFGLALENMGDIDRQSLAGAINTSTHGTGLKFTGFSGAVTGLNLMLADGSFLRTSASEHPQLFQAARVGLGALGVVTHVRLRCVPEYRMRATETIEPIDETVANFIARAAQEDHLEFLWFPGASRALVKTNTRLSAATRIEGAGPVSRFINDEILANLGLQAVCSTAARVPRMNKKLAHFATSMLSDRSSVTSWHDAYATARRVRFNEMEYAFALDQFDSVFAQIRHYFSAARQPVVFPIEVRITAADDTWLGTASGRPSVYIAVHHYVKEQANGYFEDMEAIFRAAGGRPHWGKEHSLDPKELSSLYPRFNDFLDVRQDVDPRGRFLNPYLQRLLGVRK